MIYAVANTITNKVVKTGTCPTMAILLLQAGVNQVAVDISTLDPIVDETLWFYDGTTISPRVHMSSTIGGATTLTTPLTILGPAGSLLTIDSEAVGTLDSSGSTAIAFTDAGTYQVTLSLWPWLDTSVDVVVS